MRTLKLIDAYNFFFRAYYALPHLTDTKGTPVGAIYGFISMLLKQLTPFEHIIIACDSNKKTFRETIYPAYKIHRKAPPDELIPQFALLKEFLEISGIPYFEKEGFEADDIIATLAKQGEKEGFKVIIASSDKDLMQLVNTNICLLDTLKDKYINTPEVLNKFGVRPEQLKDLLALVGDSVDNIPGIPGIGPKGAAALLEQFSTLEEIYNNLDQVSKPRIKTLLEKYKAQALISQQLLQLFDKVPLEAKIEDLIYRPTPHLMGFLKKYSFDSLIARFNKGHKLNFNEEFQGSYLEFQLECERSGLLAIYIEAEEVYLSFKEDNTLKIPKNIFLQNFQQVLASNSVKKIAFDIKALLKIVSLSSFEDIMAMAYTLYTTRSTLAELLNKIGESLDKNTVTSNLLKLYKSFEAELFNRKLITLYQRLDKPLITVVDEMEKRGVLIDKSILINLSAQYTTELNELENAIFDMVGKKFLIASQKQLSEVLAIEMGLPLSKRSKSGNYSTTAEVLEKLQGQGYSIASKILRWRHLSKLKSTYTDAFLTQINPKDGRLHTNYSLTATSTGRLSSNNPNLQNIPDSPELRRAFVSPHNYTLLSADYSQIEIRLLAYMAEIPELLEALARGEDLHQITAAQVFKVPLNEVTQHLRQKAKAINFGIIYGITAFGLAKQLDISREEAADLISDYFARYPGIRYYMNKACEQAKEKGYVLTLFGRCCFIPDISSNIPYIRKFGERAAINGPLQGTAADIIKKAMLKVEADPITKGLMILQIHDELILEVPTEKKEVTGKILQQHMEQIGNLNLKTELKYGKNLGELQKIYLT